MNNINKIEEKIHEELNNNNANKKEQIIAQEKEEKIIEFNEHMNIKNINEKAHLNLDRNMSMSMNNVENMTFLKKNTTGKESFISEMSKKDLDKNCLLQVSSVIKNSKINEFSNELKKINTHINKTLRDSAKKRSISNNTKNSLINPNVCLSLLSKERNDTNSNSSSNKIKNLFKKSFTRNEKLIYNSFKNYNTRKYFSIKFFI